MPKNPGTSRSHKVSDDAWEAADRVLRGQRSTPQKRAIGDAWETADRLMRGQRLTPPKRVFEEDAPPMEDSDDDFEPHVATQRIASARPSASRKSSTSALRDDRTSMTKRSGNKSKRTEPVGHVPSQQRSVFEQYGLPPKMAPLSSSEDDDDDDHVVVFEGEKSSLSGTDNEDDRGVNDIDMDAATIEPSQSQERPASLPTDQEDDKSLQGREEQIQIDAGELEIDSEVCLSASPPKRVKNISGNQGGGNNSCTKKTISAPTIRTNRAHLNSPPVVETLEESSLSPAGSRRIRSASQEPRTIGLQKCSSTSQDVFESPSPKRTTPRRRKIRPLFMPDSDSSDSEKRVCQERRRRGRLKSSVSKPPSTFDNVELEACAKPSAGAMSRSVFESVRKLPEEICSQPEKGESESSDLEIVPNQLDNEDAENKKLKSGSQGRNGHELATVGELAVNNESPIRTPRNRKRKRKSPDARKQTISKYIATASPSLSPPSTLKKRRRLRRLVLAASSEEDDAIDGLENDRNDQNGPKRPNQTSAASTALDGLSGTPRSAEWYHERDIDEFSESSSDEKPSSKSNYVTRAVTRRRRRAVRSSPSQRSVLPVRRNISKSFDLSPDQRPILRAAAAKRSSSDRRVSTEPAQSLKTHEPDDLAYDVDAEVIDLVDDDDEPVIASNGSYPGSAKVDSSLSSAGDKIDSSNFDEDAPPPFNLVALCNDGESIREMKERLGEEYVIDKVTEAQENGREIFGGEEIGLTGSYNKGIFDRFSRTLGADEVAKRREAKSVTEQALRGEYKFHYRGRERDSKTGKRGGSSRGGSSREGSSWRGKGYYGARYRRKRGSS